MAVAVVEIRAVTSEATERQVPSTRATPTVVMALMATRAEVTTVAVVQVAVAVMSEVLQEPS